MNITLKHFWDLKTKIVMQTQEETEMTPLEKIARKKVEQLLTYNNARYEVAVPWKHGTATRQGMVSTAFSSGIPSQRNNQSSNRVLCVGQAE